MNEIQEGFSDRTLFKQSNELNGASYRLSEVSQNIIMTLISEIKSEDSDFKDYRFYIKDLEGKIGKKIDRSYLDKISDELLRNTIKIKKGENAKNFLKINWISSFEYFNDEGLFEVSFDPKLKPYLLNVKDKFALGFLGEFTEIKGEYSKRIYMLVRQYAFRRELKIDVEELKTMLLIPKSMQEYKVFKSRIINPTVAQINSKTSLNISIEEVREGRKISQIIFKISDKIIDKKTEKKNNRQVSLGEWDSSVTIARLAKQSK